MAPSKTTTLTAVQSNGVSKLATTGAPAVRTPGSKIYLEYDERYVTRGIPPLPVVISKAEGARLWDPEGKEYIDFVRAEPTCALRHLASPDDILTSTSWPGSRLSTRDTAILASLEP
jgi:hypothetical protein